MDHNIGKIIEKLKELGLFESTVIIVVGDHGEGLGEHVESEHGYFVYQDTIRVPFIIRPPGGLASPLEIEEAASLVDIVPTLLSYLDISIPGSVQGKDLSMYLKGGNPSTDRRYVYIESFIPTNYGCNPLIGLADNQWKYIDTTHAELYNLYTDPEERVNLIEKETNRAHHMKNQLQQMTVHLKGPSDSDSRIELDEKSRKQLEGLGYIGTVHTQLSSTVTSGGSDPKEYIGYHEYAQKAVTLQYHKRLKEAKAVCEKMISEWSQMPEAYLLFGKVSYSLGEFNESINQFKHYLELVGQPDLHRPESVTFNLDGSMSMAHERLGSAYYKLQQYEKATEHFRASLEKKSDDPEVHTKLAESLFELGLIQEANDHLVEAIRSDKKSFRAHHLLGKVFYQRGKIQDAIRSWKQAVKLEPLNSTAFHNLGTAYYRLGKFKQAKRYWEESLRLEPNNQKARNNLRALRLKTEEPF